MKLTVQKLGINGEGIAYLDSKPVFIDDALPTEVVDVTLTSKTTTYAKAKINKIIKKSNDRVEPQCPYQKDCGGCSLMHMNEKAQSYYKRQLLLSTPACSKSMFRSNTDRTIKFYRTANTIRRKYSCRY